MYKMIAFSLIIKLQLQRWRPKVENALFLFEKWHLSSAQPNFRLFRSSSHRCHFATDRQNSVPGLSKTYNSEKTFFNAHFFRRGSHVKMYTISLGKVTSVEKMLILFSGAARAHGHFYQRRDNIFLKKVTERPPNEHSERDFRS